MLTKCFVKHITPHLSGHQLTCSWHQNSHCLLHALSGTSELSAVVVVVVYVVVIYVYVVVVDFCFVVDVDVVVVVIFCYDLKRRILEFKVFVFSGLMFCHPAITAIKISGGNIWKFKLESVVNFLFYNSWEQLTIFTILYVLLQILAEEETLQCL